MNESTGYNEHRPTPEQKEREYHYDAIIVLGGGLHKVDDKYYPTDYRQGDQFGMLGAGMRMVAALDLYLKGESKNFVFTTGVTEKNKSVYGPDVPTEASVYQDKFLRVLDAFDKREDLRDTLQNLEAPIITLEDKSSTTLGNVTEVLRIIQEKGWNHVAIVSSDYHIPRIQAIYQDLLAKNQDITTTFDFLSAEHIATTAEPGKYEDAIRHAYETEAAQLRQANEAKGLQDIKAGTYAKREFQLPDEGEKENT